MEKVIGEFKIIETEDGYRIEVKSDKGKMKKVFSGFPWHGFRGRGFPFGYSFWG